MSEAVTPYEVKVACSHCTLFFAKEQITEIRFNKRRVRLCPACAKQRELALQNLRESLR